MRPSARASGAPGQVWAPWPNARWWRALARSTWNSAGCSKRLGSRFAAPLTTMTVVPAAISTPPSSVVTRASRKSPFTGLSMRRHSSTKFGMSCAVLAEQLLELLVLADALQRRAEEAHGRLLTGGEEIGGDARDVDRLRNRAVGKRRGRHAGHHVVARVAAAVLDVRGELLVEELERVVRELGVAGAADGAGLFARPGAEPLTKQLVVALRYAEQVGDDEHGERLPVPADELGAAAFDELVDLAVGEAPHERFVLAKPLRRDEAHEQRAVRGVDRRVEGEKLIAERQLVAVLLDQRTDVVAFERNGEAGKRSGRRVARRERGGVVVDRDRFVVPGHHHHVVVALAAAPGTARAASRSTGRGRRRVRRRGRSRSRRSRSRRRLASRRCTGRSNRIGGVDFSLTESERDLVGLCRDFAQKEIADAAPHAWEEARCPTDLLREMGALGLLGMLIPEEWGGIGMSTVGFVAAMEQLGAGRPVGGRRVAGARDHRFAAAVPLRHRRAARALAATVGRGTRARRVRLDRARRGLRRARHPHACRSGATAAG